ncbi:MAG: ankyrin repeat domain-containing protein [Vulcanimicrobiota bacterium]
MSQLHRAVLDEDIEELVHILDKNSNVNLFNVNKLTPLHLAVYRDNLEATRILLAKNANCNLSDIDGFTPLARAVEKGHSETIKMVYQNRDDLNFGDKNNRTLLHIAVEKNHAEIARLLSELMGELDIPDGQGITPLQRAIMNSQAEPGWFLVPGCQLSSADTWGKIQGGKVPVIAYIVWALAESGYTGPSLNKGIGYIKKNIGQFEDPYVLALVTNALATMEPENQLTRELLEKLKSKAEFTKDSAYWTPGVATATYSTGSSANMETTAMAALAFMKVEGYEELANKAVSYLVQSKDSFGTWYSTKSTVLAMKALLTAQEKAGKSVDARVEIMVNGEASETFQIDSENYELFRQADFSHITRQGSNTVEGKGACFYQVTARHYIPWKLAKQNKHLAIEVKYDRTQLKTDDLLTSTVTVKNNTKAAMKMVMVDLGIPPGFTVMTPDQGEYVGGKFQKYNMTSRQMIIYVDTLKAGEDLKFKYRLKARYPLRAKTPESKAYQYYNPGVEDKAQPVTLDVKE